MPVQPPSEADELKMVYQEIIEGCTRSSKGFFIKHLYELEQIELTRKRIEFIQDYVNQGIPSEDDRLTRLKEDGEWSNEKDEDIKAYRQTIADNERMVTQVIAQQQGAIRHAIATNRQQLIALLTERKNLIGTTAEELADRDGSAFLAYLSLHKDRVCMLPLFAAWEEFESLDEETSQKYLDEIDHALGRLNEKNVRRIAALPFFLNSFSYCKDNIQTFLNKPISQLTNYQVHLFSLGSRNLNILAQASGSPPDYFDKVTADAICLWYDQQYSIIIGKRKQ